VLFDSVAAIAWSPGCESESSFGTAFKRIMACSPSQYRRQAVAARGDAVVLGQQRRVAAWPGVRARAPTFHLVESAGMRDPVPESHQP